MEKVFVVAGTHGPVAMEDNGRRFIGEKPVEVPLSTYYRRRLSGGELSIVQNQAKPSAPNPTVITSATPEAK